MYSSFLGPSFADKWYAHVPTKPDGGTTIKDTVLTSGKPTSPQSQMVEIDSASGILKPQTAQVTSPWLPAQTGGQAEAPRKRKTGKTLVAHSLVGSI